MTINWKRPITVYDESSARQITYGPELCRVKHWADWHEDFSVSYINNGQFIIPPSEAGQAEHMIVDFMAARTGSGTPTSSNKRTFAGVNKISAATFGTNNILRKSGNSTESRGVTITVNDDLSLTLYGRSTSGGATYNVPYESLGPFDTDITFKMTGGSNNVPLILNGESDTGAGVVTTITAGSGNIVPGLYIYNNTDYDVTIYPVVVMGNGVEYSLGEVCYGGTLDMITKKYTKIWGYISSYAGESLPSRWKSDRDVYAAGAVPSTGAKVVYMLATPVETTLTANPLVNRFSEEGERVSVAVSYGTIAQGSLGHLTVKSEGHNYKNLYRL